LPCNQNFYFPCAIIDEFASGKGIKKSDMRNTFIFTVLAVMILSSFSKKQESMNNYQTSGKQEITLDSTKWWLTKIYTTDSFTEVPTKKAFIRLNKADGKISGNGSCNSFGGKLTITGNNISLDNIFSTKMYCDDVQSIENEFFRQLEKVTRYENKGKRLLLLEGDNRVLEFEAR
jgi:heat shock protein HslJ